MPEYFIIHSNRPGNDIAASILGNPIEYLKGVGPLRAELLQKELNIFTFQDLLELFPYRHVDRTKINLIREIGPQTEYIQVAGRVTSVDVLGDKRSRRLVAELRDSSGVMELVWFQGINGVQKLVQVGRRVSWFLGEWGFSRAVRRSRIPRSRLWPAMAADRGEFLEPDLSDYGES